MGKSSKKSNVEVAPITASVTTAKSAKKGKRVAEEVKEKPVSAKKQKVEVVAPKQKDNKKSKKAPPPKKKPETSSSEDVALSESEEEENTAVAKKPPSKSAPGPTPKKKQESSESSDSSDSEDESNVAEVAIPAKGIPATSKIAPTNGSKKERSSDSSDSDSDSDEDKAPPAKVSVPVKGLATTEKKDLQQKPPSNAKVEESSDESSDESDEEAQKKKLKVLDAVPKPKVKAVSKDSSSDEDEDEDDSSEESSDDEPPKTQQNKPTKTSKKSSSEEDSSEEESEDEQPVRTPKKDADVKMEDVPSANATEKQTATKSEKKGLQTPASNQSEKSGSKTLFVGNLSYDVGEDDVVEFFKEAGGVVDVRLAEGDDGRFKGFGHVEFATEEAAQKAFEMNGQELLGRGVRLDFARARGAYTPNSGKESNSYQKGGKGQSQTIFVRGFDKSLEMNQIQSSLEEHFGSCGEITRVSLPKDYETGASKGIAYMDFKDQDAFSKALELNGSELGYHTLTVEEAKPRGDGRDGGGWSGGRGGGRFGGRRGRGRGGGGRGRGGRPR